jgi:hypothetical protein
MVHLTSQVTLRRVLPRVEQYGARHRRLCRCQAIPGLTALPFLLLRGSRWIGLPLAQMSSSSGRTAMAVIAATMPREWSTPPPRRGAAPIPVGLRQDATPASAPWRAVMRCSRRRQTAQASSGLCCKRPLWRHQCRLNSLPCISLIRRCLYRIRPSHRWRRFPRSPPLSLGAAVVGVVGVVVAAAVAAPTWDSLAHTACMRTPPVSCR